MVNLYDDILSQPFRQFALDEVLCVEFKCLDDAMIKSIWSHHNYLVYVLGGKKKWFNHEKDWMVDGGECIFVKKGASITRKYYEADFCAIIFFLPDDYIHSIIDEHQNAIPIPKTTQEGIEPILDVNVDVQLKTFFDSVMSYFTQNTKPIRSLLELKFKELVLHLLMGNNNPELTSYLLSTQEGAKGSLRQIMLNNFRYNLGLEELARMTHRSLSSFKRDFKKEFGLSPGKWLIEKKLDCAKSLLLQTDKSINDITFESGFESSSHFIRSFKGQYGCPPNQYRANQVAAG